MVYRFIPNHIHPKVVKKNRTENVMDFITGKVVKLMDFGAFVEIAPGIERLVIVAHVRWIL